MPEKFEPHDIEKAQEEVEKLQKKMESGEASSYTEAEQLIETEKQKLIFYKSHYKKDPPEGALDRLRYQQIFPDYATWVEPGKHKEYQEITPFVVFHHTYKVEDVPLVIKNGGLLSTNERLRRGIKTKGISSDIDTQTGAADYVFTRIATPEGLKAAKEENASAGVVNLVFEQGIVDRLDWHTFNEDRYGGVDLRSLSEPPEELFKSQKRFWNYGNEQMFQAGIPLENLKYLACGSEEKAVLLIDALQNVGIFEINGKPLEKVIVVTPTRIDLFTTSQGEQLSHQETVRQIVAERRKNKQEKPAQISDELGL